MKSFIVLIVLSVFTIGTVVSDAPTFEKEGVCMCVISDCYSEIAGVTDVETPVETPVKVYELPMPGSSFDVGYHDNYSRTLLFIVRYDPTYTLSALNSGDYRLSAGTGLVFNKINNSQLFRESGCKNTGHRQLRSSYWQLC